MELSDQQNLYLQTIFDYFHIEGEWPTFRYLDRELMQTMDIEKVISSLPEGLTNPFSANNPDQQALLTVPALHLCRGSESDLSDFVWMIRLCVEKYFSKQQDNTKFSSHILYQSLGMSDVAIHKVGLLIQWEPYLYRWFGFDEDNVNWACEIARDIRRFQGVESIDEYLAERNIATPVGNVTSPATKNSSENIVTPPEPADLQLHPEIRLRCWNLYTTGNYDNAILNATKCLEVAVRSKARIPADKVGAEVMTRAFSPDRTILEYSKVRSEQESMMYLTRGIIGVFKNPQSHRFVGIENKSECLGILLMCSGLLYAVENTTYVASP